jgi:chorismate mutase
MDISDWRKKIDEVDAAVLKLLNLRAEMALEIGKLKSAGGIGLRAPAREREVIERMQAANPGPFDAEAIATIYVTIVNQCTRVQELGRSVNSAQTSSGGALQARPAGKSGAANMIAKAGMSGSKSNTTKTRQSIKVGKSNKRGKATK